MVEKLLELGANPNAMNKFGMVPLHHAAVAGGSPEVIVALIKAGADVSRVFNIYFDYAIIFQRHPFLSNEQVDKQDNGGRLPLHWAAGHGHTEVAEALLGTGKVW